ncbi:MAG: lytic murein transglycosylase [Acidobacteriota bacterium]
MSLLLVAIAVLLSTAGANAVGSAQEQPSFDDWLAALRTEALGRGISERTVTAALGGIEPLPIVLERDRAQAETTLTIEQYLRQRLTPRVVRTARDMAIRHRQMLGRVSAAYGVPASIVVAIWGLESNFGRFTGVRPTIATLVTLAYDGRRSLFREELFSALRIIDEDGFGVDELRGSWAGAMGQPQFMPSSYLRYAVDYDRDGRRDIWATLPDVFASMANYLRANGWKTGVRWGRGVSLSKAVTLRVRAAVPARGRGACEAVRSMSEARSVNEWRALGVKLANGSSLPASNMAASLVRVDRHAYLVYQNYEALLSYNCAHPYALSVALLADRIR